MKKNSSSLATTFLIVTFALASQVGLCKASSANTAGIQVGDKLPLIELSGDAGGRVKENPETKSKNWSSQELRDKVHVIFYVAPSQKELNRKASSAITAAKFPRDKYSSVAVVNLASSWIPNFLISKKIEASQKEFPHTTYVKDIKRAFVEKWGLKDKSNDVVIVDKNGKVAFVFRGKLADKDIENMLKVMRKHILGDKPVKKPASKTTDKASGKKP